MDDLRGRDNGVDRECCAVQILNDAFAHPFRRAVPGRHFLDPPVGKIGHIVERRHIDAFNLRGCAEEALFCPALPLGLPVELRQLRVHFLSFPDHSKVDKIRYGFRVIHAGAPRKDDGPQLRSVPAAKGDPGQREHVQNPDKGHFIAHGKTDQIEISQRIAAFQGAERHAGSAHGLRHVPPGFEYPLAPDARHLIQDAIEDSKAQIGHADLISIRETEGKADLRFLLVLQYLAEFAAGIAGWLLDLRQDRFHRRMHLHSLPLVNCRYHTRFSGENQSRRRSFTMRRNSQRP